MSRHNRKPVCPICDGVDVVRLDPDRLTWKEPSHKCESCGAALVTKFTRTAGAYVMLGVALMFGVFGLWHVAGVLALGSSGFRATAAVVLLVCINSLAVSGVLRSLRFSVWEAKL